MKKKRGLRKYYKSLGTSDFLDHLDFSGSENSWFDFYHIHIDDIGLGNKSWKSRAQHLDALFLIAKRIEKKLNDYPKDFQYWIEIDENDSREDCIYIHTENPNGSLFPTQVNDNVNAKTSNERLINYLTEKEYKIMKQELSYYEEESSTTYFLQKENLGLKIK